MSEITTTPSGEKISNVPLENVLAGKHWDGTTTPMPHSPVQLVREEKDAGGEYLGNPDGLFQIYVECDNGLLRTRLLEELRYFLNDPARSAQFLPKVRDALAREQQTNTTIPK